MTLGHSFESVLDAAKLGAHWAWAVLYGEIAGPVTGFFRSRGVADPEEAAGDVFFELARGLTAFEESEEETMAAAARAKPDEVDGLLLALENPIPDCGADSRCCC